MLLPLRLHVTAFRDQDPGSSSSILFLGSVNEKGVNYIHALVFSSCQINEPAIVELL